jgi:hypothetical protein
MFRRIYSTGLTALACLWKLFRGKKQNIFRHRVDSKLFSTDQMMLGTLLFALCVFLMPTIAAYYVFFSGLKVLLVTVQSMLLALSITYQRCPTLALFCITTQLVQVPVNVTFKQQPQQQQQQQQQQHNATTRMMALQSVDVSVTQVLTATVLQDVLTMLSPASPIRYIKAITTGSSFQAIVY